jgi:hypothetical protein
MSTGSQGLTLVHYPSQSLPFLPVKLSNQTICPKEKAPVELRSVRVSTHAGSAVSITLYTAAVMESYSACQEGQ